MKKTTIYILIIIILLALLLSVYFSLTKKAQDDILIQKQDIISNEPSQVDFQNKMECYNLKEKIEKDIQIFNAEQKPEKRTVDRGAIEDYMCYEQKELKEIFFSKKLNTCLHVEIYKTICKSLMSYSSGEYYVSYETDYLINTLNDEKIDFNNGLNFLQIINNGEQFNTQEDANIIINEYK